MAQQAPTGQCNGAGSMQGVFSLSPTSGLAGSTTLLAGSTQLFPALSQESTTVGAWWMEPGNEQYLSGFPLTIDQDTLIGTFSGNITIPGNAALGPHSVAFMLPGDTDPACLTFTVTAAGGSVPGDTPVENPVETISRLPETGLNTGMAVYALALVASGVLLNFHNFSKGKR